ncbi:pyridoxal-dependent decarboxylase domain-containing protein 1 [Neodiprion pinetum]|uniref:Pyridoxal-dependent decarboxylase domain-containing protein 1 n=1 Tax=Neodiprion lecontei TaxID=441921 RepID=A0A6J0C5Y6_NEOLC|nr:pyridoxal-dependent decarboxylase domain-containing protein 1 [Neodiprion lecontei]XP_046410749.1 pyridoxal-dependent decarboxylase domain-containing protein 1 [Neodiprion fabricii]XP_046470164.1 pyridoxal-dependent decarboxylase domain-containing protein 1 [Neodiprion pinetum]XP_046604001.1 pyridoxal-dependent decarboxylase domain-containing protein 1 [Neodiprion virginianus]
MAEEVDTNRKAAMEDIPQNSFEVTAAAESRDNEVGALEFQASQVISRLEEAVERAADGGGTTWNNPSGFLSQAKSPEEILALIQDLVIHEDAPVQTTDGESNEPLASQLTTLPTLTDAAKLSLVANSVSAYAAALPRAHAQRLAGRLAADTTRWLSHIFRFVDCASSFHEDHLEGLVRVARLALHRKYPRYIEDGFTALAASPPLIYSSVAAPLGVVQHLCRQLSLPLHCMRPIPHNTMFGSRHSMDVSALERRLAEDSQSNSVTPLLVLAEAGSMLTGHCDNITRLREICDKYNVWLHLRGHSLAALTLNNSTKDLPAKIADSVTLPVGTWLGIPSLPVVTLYRLTDTKGGRPTPRDTTLSLVSGLMSDSLSRRLPTLPLWAALQALGRDGIQNRFKQCFLAVEELYNKIKKFNCIRLLSQTPGGETGSYTINELLTNPIGSPQLYEIVASSLVLQFIPADRDPQATERVPPYYDKLNSWLGQTLPRDVENVQIELCEIEQHGVAIRICPIEYPDKPPTSEDIDNVVACLEQQIEILLATVEHKETFVKLVSENDSLHLVDMAGWAGLGGVRYAPPTWANVMTDQAKDELNRLNTQLVEALRSTDAAFSLGEGADGLACVRFGMVTQDTDVAELLSLVLQVGQEVEASSKLLDTMSEVVKRGIEAAQTDLERENAEKLWQEGILRHVPVVGTFVNWWSPPNKEAGVRGRSLNLQAGVVESTENIYKYHMQLQPNSTNSNGSGARTPPQPLVQTPVGANSQSHSRSSSHSSLQSGKSVLSISNTACAQPQVKEESTEQAASS